MSAIPYHVAEAFGQGKPARAGNFTSDGHTLRSYGMVLAEWDYCGMHNAPMIRIEYRLKALGGTAPTVTTSRHMSAFESLENREFHFISAHGAHGSFERD